MGNPVSGNDALETSPSKAAYACGMQAHAAGVTAHILPNRMQASATLVATHIAGLLF